MCSRTINLIIMIRVDDITNEIVISFRLNYKHSETDISKLEWKQIFALENEAWVKPYSRKLPHFKFLNERKKTWNEEPKYTEAEILHNLNSGIGCLRIKYERINWHIATSLEKTFGRVKRTQTRGKNQENIFKMFVKIILWKIPRAILYSYTDSASILLFVMILWIKTNTEFIQTE